MTGEQDVEKVSRDPDVQYCPHCGESITQRDRRFFEDLVLNRYRTEFRCPACGYKGDVFRHNCGASETDLMTDGGREQSGDRVDRPEWYARDGSYVPLLGVVETVTHHYWNDVSDWRFHRHGESHIAAEGI